jgi:murein DD-endopeptidase MepM/ murein hydrolase activator NlpD
MAVPAPQPQAAPEGQQRVAGVLNGAQPAVTQPAAAPAVPAPVVAAPAAVASAAAAVVSAPIVVAHGAVDQFARVLASAGVDVRHLFTQYGVNRGEGGPVVPLARGQVVQDTMTPEKLAALRAMVKVLPVHAPLDSYEVSSPFGPRGDPEDGRGEFHTGVDLRAPYDSPVYATAPGVVTYAGYRDDYGKIVEIDHGNGIATRYAHLHAFTVSVGQRVGLHQQIGYLGSTGRATGPHTHYEVVVNGEPQDPQKFINLGRYVPSMTVPVAARN